MSITSAYLQVQSAQEAVLKAFRDGEIQADEFMRVKTILSAAEMQLFAIGNRKDPTG